MSTLQKFSERKNFQLQWTKKSNKLKRDNAEELKVWKRWMIDNNLPYTAIIVDDRYLELKLQQNHNAIAIVIQNSCYCSLPCRENDDKITNRSDDEAANWPEHKRSDLVSSYDRKYKTERLSCSTDLYSCNCTIREGCQICPHGHYGLKYMLKFFKKVGCSTIRLYFNQNARQMRSIFTEESEGLDKLDESDKSEESNNSNKSNESEELKESLDEAKHLKNLRKFKTVFTYYCGHGTCEGYDDASMKFFDYRTIPSRLMFDFYPGSKRAMHVEGNRIEKICSFHQSCQVKPNGSTVRYKPDDHDIHFHRLQLPFGKKISKGEQNNTKHPSSKDSALKEKVTIGSVAPAPEGVTTCTYLDNEDPEKEPAEWGCTRYIPIIPGCVNEMFKDDENFVDNLVNDETTFMEFCKRLSEKTHQLMLKKHNDRENAYYGYGEQDPGYKKIPEFDYSIRSFAMYPERSENDQENTSKVSINMEVLNENEEPFLVFKTDLEDLKIQKAKIGGHDTTIPRNDGSDMPCSEVKTQNIESHPEFGYCGEDLKYSIEKHFSGWKDDDFFKLFFKN